MTPASHEAPLRGRAQTGAVVPPDGSSLTVGLGASEIDTADMVLNIGPQHPSTHGVLRLRVTLDGERITRAEPIVGYMHRGAEKLFEVRDYRQIIVLANRHDWLSAFANELGVVLGAERMLGMEVPERAVWARTLLAELNRVLNHLMFLGSYPLELGAITPVFYAFREREELQAVMEEVSGGRMHYMFNRVGGLKEDLPAGWTTRVLAARGRRPGPDARLEALISGNEILRARTRGVGVLSRELAAAYGVRGRSPAAAGSTSTCAATSPTWRTGSCSRRRPWPRRHARRGRLPGPARGAARAGRTCRSTSPSTASTGCARCRRGRSTCGCRRCCACPRGTLYTWTENPLGVNGYYLVSRGDKVPWRLKLRSASFNNVQVLSRILPGRLVADMVAVLGSTFFVVGDVDK